MENAFDKIFEAISIYLTFAGRPRPFFAGASDIFDENLIYFLFSEVRNEISEKLMRFLSKKFF